MYLYKMSKGLKSVAGNLPFDPRPARVLRKTLIPLSLFVSPRSTKQPQRPEAGRRFRASKLRNQPS
jgi:hypothetical protein